MHQPQLPEFRDTQRLPEWGTWPETVHVFDAESKDALTAAYLAERPLLVVGEPGSGKSQLARAAAVAMGRAFVHHVVHARTEAQELQWEFDAVARLGEAQLQGAGAQARPRPWQSARDQLDPRRFLYPGPLWWTFDWQRALDHTRAFCPRKLEPASRFADWSPGDGCVLLIDEIDKADADLPNGLLETLGNGAFPVPWLAEPVTSRGGPPPLVVITSNGERDLPPAFLRRCLELRLKVPPAEQTLEDFLCHRGRHHFPDCEAIPAGWPADTPCSSLAVRLAVAERLAAVREQGTDAQLARPGQAEYLDILRVLVRAHPCDPKAQQAMLERVADFALHKTGRTPE